MYVRVDTIVVKGYTYVTKDSMRVTRYIIRNIKITDTITKAIGHCDKKSYYESLYTSHDTDIVKMYSDTTHSISIDTLRKTSSGVELSENIQAQISIYPNPSNGNFTIEIPESEQGSDYDLKVFNVQGKLVNQQTVVAGLNSIETRSVLPGCYTLLIVNADKVFTKKLIIY